MKCKDYHLWLHLNRDGELTSRQAVKLERHLRRCSSCALEKSAIEKADRLIQLARAAVPQPPEPEELTNRIMNSIEPSMKAARSPSFAKQGNRWFDWFYIPKVRLAMMGIAVVMLGVFIFQGALILHRIGRLEEKMARQPEAPVSTETILSKRMTHARIARILEQADLIYENLPGDDDRVVIRKRTLRRLLRLLVKPPQGNEKLIEQLLLQISLLDEIDIENGIEKRELRKIVEKKKAILKEMYKL